MKEVHPYCLLSNIPQSLIVSLSYYSLYLNLNLTIDNAPNITEDIATTSPTTFILFSSTFYSFSTTLLVYYDSTILKNV